MKVTLSWPPGELSPNWRGHRLERARVVKWYRQSCGWECKEQGLRAMAVRSLHIDITFNPPDARPRDLDNMLASIKAGLDGLSDVTGVDDSLWSLTIRRGRPNKEFPNVVIEIMDQMPRAIAVEIRGTIA